MRQGFRLSEALQVAETTAALARLCSAMNILVTWAAVGWHPLQFHLHGKTCHGGELLDTGQLFAEPSFYRGAAGLGYAQCCGSLQRAGRSACGIWSRVARATGRPELSG